MLKIRRIIERILGISFIYIAYYILFSFLNGAYTDSITNCLFMLTNYIIFLAAYFLSIKIKNIFLYVIGLILLFIPCLYLSNATFFYKLMTLLIIMYTFSKRLNPEKTVNIGLEAMAALFMFSFGLYILAPSVHIEFMRVFILAENLIIVITSIIYTHLKGINSELELTTAESLQPIKSILAFNNRVLLCCVLTTLIVIYFAITGGIKNIVMAIYYFIKNILHYLLQGISVGANEPSDIMPVYELNNNQSFDVTPAPTWIKILEEIFIYVFGTIIIVTLLAVIFITILNIYRRFYKNKDNMDFSEFILTESKIEKLERKKLNSVFIKNKTRRKFYNIVKKHYKSCNIKKSDTPTDIKEKIKDKTDISTLLPLYEKIRYGKPQE